MTARANQIARIACALAPHRACSYCSDVKGFVNLDEFPGKVVGHRGPPADPLAITPADRIEDARAWKAAFGPLRIPKGVYRFRTHEEADEWLWQMLTRHRH
jgi:hypothetical protein